MGNIKPMSSLKLVTPLLHVSDEGPARCTSYAKHAQQLTANQFERTLGIIKPNEEVDVPWSFVSS